MDAVEIVAHRGSSFLAPENTRAAIELAWQEGADAVEADFRLTADGQIVALHDATLKRTAGIDQPVHRCSLEELRRCDVGVWRGPEFAGQFVPTLDELLVTLPPGKRFFVEVKCGPEIADELLRVVSCASVEPEQVVPIGLDAETIAHIKRTIPQCPAYWVVQAKVDAAGAYWLPNSDDIWPIAEAAGVNGLDLQATGPIDAELVRRARAEDLALCAWTVDDPNLARRLIDYGVESLTTNRPGWLREQLRR